MTDSVLVTGASGFVGSHLIDLLSAHETALVGWYRPDTAPPQDGDRVRWMAVDLMDPGAVRRGIGETRPAVIYHCAGAAHAGDSWRHAASTLDVNVLGTHHLLEAARSTGVASRVLIPGSALVYRPSDGALTEDSPLGPGSPYATSKLAQELLGIRVAHDDGVPVFVTRSFNHLGPRQDPSFAASSFARQLARIERELAEPVIHAGNLEVRRDFTDVRDVVRAYQAVTERGIPARIYNVCSARTYRVAEILEQLVDLAQVAVKLQIDAARVRPDDVPLLLGDRRRIEEEVGWAPTIPIQRTLNDLLDYWRERAEEEVRGARRS